MNTAQDEFIQSHSGEMTPELAAQLLELEGDSGAALQTGDEPDVSTSAEVDQPAREASKNDEGTAAPHSDPPERELTADNAVIQAKDGKHTISYDKLVAAREGEQAAKQALQNTQEQLQATQQELERLRAEAQQRADAGIAPTAADQQLAVAEAAMDAGVDMTLFGSFSEEEIAKGIQTLVDRQVSAVLERVDAAVRPLQEAQKTAVTDAHYGAIYAQHPDADSLIESKELADWIASQPSFARAACEAVLSKGSSQEVIELFDSFKQATGLAQPAVDKSAEDLKAAAKAAIAKTAAPVPASLSDFPGGRATGLTQDEVMADLNGPDLLAAMDSMPPEKIEQFLNRRG